MLKRSLRLVNTVCELWAFVDTPVSPAGKKKKITSKQNRQTRNTFTGYGAMFNYILMSSLG